ncbi:hypothetical protein ABFG93_04805 [Pseudalkalibacillus hwajinpoensis]|uniref:hypothetical protein n=1 Tax=Guptibacillus hwajinpoensis TaxID=208199 RepID=UPI00325AABE0
MNIIKRKRDVEALLSDFEGIAGYDKTGNKHYLVFADFLRNGKCTLMKYSDGSFSIHGKGDAYCDESELFLTEDEVTSFLWKHRKAINILVRSSQEANVS